MMCDTGGGPSTDVHQDPTAGSEGASREGP